MATLKIFCDVARHRSFSQAAQINHRTQSAVSQVISQLEERLRAQLVDRSTRPLQLTPVGQSYYECCKKLVEKYAELEECYDELEASIRNERVEIAGQVQVAAIYSVGLSDMGQNVQRFHAEFPKTQVHIDYLHPDRVYERVLDGSADLGLVSFPKKMPDLAAVHWREEEMVLVCSPRHELANRLALQMSDLRGQRYVHFDKNLLVRRRIDRFLHKHKANVSVVAEFDSIENIKQAVLIDAGIALLPAPTIHREVTARTLVAIPLYGCRLTRPLAILHHRGHRLGAAARRFMELLLGTTGTDPHQDTGKTNDDTETRKNSPSQDASRGRNGTPRTPGNRMTGS